MNQINLKGQKMKKELTRKVTLDSITDIMFDRYSGDNKTELSVDKKMYLARDGKMVVLPSTNISSFLSAINTPSAPKRLLDSRKYKSVAQAMLSYVAISPHEIPFMRGGKPIMFTGFDDNGEDIDAGIYIHRSVARLEKGIPNPKVRPVLKAPWSLEFNINVFPNEEFNEDMLKNMFDLGGIAVGLGTYRGVFGKFRVSQWK